MKNRTLKISVEATIVAIAAIVLLGFESPALAQDSSGSSQSDPMQSARGAQTWADNCNRCHNMRDPKEFRDDQWRSIVAHMRIRGGLTGQETRDVLAFLQSANDPPVIPLRKTVTLAAVTATETSVTASDGQAIYAQTCIACHGANGKGVIPGVADFTATDSPLGKTDAELVKNISEGFQSPGSFMAMPAKGGNPALTDEDIKAVLRYLRAEFGE